MLSNILFFLTVLLPVGAVITSCFGCTFDLANYSVFSVATALVGVINAIMSFVSGRFFDSKIASVLSALTAPLSFVNSVFYLFKSNTVLVAASMLVCLGCCFLSALNYGKPLALKVISLVLAGLMLLPICFFGFFALTFGNIGQNTVVQRVESPNGKYYAELIDSDQGALGGDTLVNVYEKGVNLLILKIAKKPQNIYHGEWGEFENMEIYWTGDNSLAINSVEYYVD